MYTNIRYLALIILSLLITFSCSDKPTPKKAPPKKTKKVQRPVKKKKVSIFDQNGILLKVDDNRYDALPQGLTLKKEYNTWTQFKSVVSVRELEKFYAKYLPNWTIERTKNNLKVIPPEGLFSKHEIYVVYSAKGEYLVNYFNYSPKPIIISGENDPNYLNNLPRNKQGVITIPSDNNRPDSQKSSERVWY